MADDNIFDPKKIIEKLRAQGIPDKEIAKMFGELPPPPKDIPNSERAKKLQRENAWKYKNKHQREVREEDLDPDYEPIEELRSPKPKPPKPRITRKKKKKIKRPPRNDWSAAAEERLKNLFEAGYSIAEIAKDFGTTQDAITGKIGRLRKAGWKGMVGTTHNPLPSPSPTPQNKKKPSTLNPLLRRELANILETNFGLVGKYFSKKWGLHEDNKKPLASGTGPKGDLAVSIIAGNQAIVSSLIKLDMSLRRGTSALTKAMSLSTARVTDAITNTVELIKKQSVFDQTTGSQQQVSSTKGSGGSGALGILGTVLGASLLSTLFSDHAEASVNPSDGVGDSPFPTENDLRQRGEESKKEEPPKEIEVKVKELLFDAQDIEFDADKFKFTSRNGQETNFGPQQTSKAAPSGRGSGGDTSSSSEGYNGGVSGGNGSANPNDFPGMDTTGGGSRSPIPSDADMAAKDKKWFEGGSKKSGAAPGSFQDRFDAVNDLSSNDLSREKFDEMFKGTGMEGKYDKVVAEAQKNGISPSLMAGVIAHETAKGTSNMFRNKNNPAGLMDPATGMSSGQSFESVDSGIEAAGKTIAKNWRRGGQTIEGMSKSYAPVGAANDPGGLNSSWPSGVKGFMKQMQAPVTTSSTLTPEQLQKAGVSRLSEDAVGGKVFDNASQGKDRLYVSPNRDASTAPVPPPTSGSDLSGAQKEQDSQSFEDRWNSRVAPEKRSDASDPGSSSSDTIHTVLLETQGPNHFHDFPMSDQGTGA